MSEFLIYQSGENQIEVMVQFENDTVWLNRQQFAVLFDRDIKTVGKHLNNIFKEGELDKTSTVAKFATVQKEGGRLIQREIEFYNLDVIISVGYRVNSKQGIIFRKWATARLKEYLINGYSINQYRLQQKQQEVEFLRTGIRIVSRTIKDNFQDEQKRVFLQFANGLLLLDDYDHESLDRIGNTFRETVYPTYEEYTELINDMNKSIDSKVFAQPKDDSFYSSINQIKQSIENIDLYPSIEEKAANLLYFITKNHSFVDGNKRIAAACFLYFLQQNNSLYNENGIPIITNETLAMLTLYIANSKSNEKEVVNRLTISVLNRNS